MPIQYFAKLRLSFDSNIFEVYGEKMRISEVVYASGFKDSFIFLELSEKILKKIPKEN